MKATSISESEHMTKEDFFVLAKVYMERKVSEDYSLGMVLRGLQPYERRREEPSIDGFLRAAETGGVSGGSCWDSSNPQPYTSTVDDPGIGATIDGFLEEHFPSVSFMTYRKLVARVSSRDHTEREYYGNCTNYRLWTLSFEDAWSVLETA